MALLFLFSLLAGFATALSPCILPILPIILASSTTQHRLYPLGVVTGLVITFSLATLFLAQLIQSLGVSDQTLRTISAAVLFLMALTMLLPQAETLWNKLISYLPQPKQSSSGKGFLGGAFIGATLGIVWAPCAGPILASITTLIATQGVNIKLIAMLVGFGIGISIPLLIIAYGGSLAINSIKPLKRSTGAIRKGFGLLTAVTAGLIFFNAQATVAANVSAYLPTSFTAPLEKIERSDVVQIALQGLDGTQVNDKRTTDNTISALPVIQAAPEFKGLTNWINSEPLTLQQLRGKVVLVDFWTYSCVNCLRTLPYVSAWYEKYKDAGLVVVGVHAPEFAFEHDPTNVSDAVARLGIKYPVALDNAFGTWRAFQNKYWPAHYFIDRQGNIRKEHFGEGEYDESENTIKQLLAEGGTTVTANEVSSPESLGYGGATSGQSPETYLGSARRERVAVSDATPGLHGVALSKNWVVNKENIESVSNDDTLLFHVRAQKVYLVAQSDTPADIRVQIVTAGKKILSEHRVNIHDAKLYEVQNFGSLTDGMIQIIPETSGVKLFAFTFGT